MPLLLVTLLLVLLLLALFLLVPGAPPASSAAPAWSTASPAPPPGGAASSEWTARFPAAAIDGAAFNTPAKTHQVSSASHSCGGFWNPVSNRPIEFCAVSVTLETGGGGELCSELLRC